MTMDKFTSRWLSAPFWQELTSVKTCLIEAGNQFGGNEDARSEIHRMELLVELLDRRLSAVDAVIVPEVLGTDLQSALQAVRGQFESAAAENSSARLQKAGRLFDAVTAVALRLPAASSSADLDAIIAAANRNFASATESAGALERQRVEVVSNLEALQTDMDRFAATVESQISRMDGALNEFQRQFTTSQGDRNSQFTTQLSAQVMSLQEAMQRRQDELSESVRVLESSYREQLDTIVKFHDQRSGEQLAKLSTYEADASKLLGIVGNRSVNAGFAQARDTARNVSRMWQGLTVLALLGLVGMAFWAVLSASAGDVSWQWLAAKVFASLTCGVLAAYAGKQGERYATEERKNGRLAMEFAAIGPFIAPLTEEQQREFRVKIGHRAFARRETEAQTNAPLAGAIAELLKSKEIRALIEKALKSSGD